MPKLTIGHHPELTPESVLEIFRNRFGQQYEVYRTKLLGADFVIKKSGWTGVSVKLIQKADRTMLRFGGFAPSFTVRLLFMGAIPALICYFVTWKKLQNEVREFIETAPEFA